MKALNIFLVVLFTASAAVQYNDPDPYIWIPIYLFGAIICYQAFKKIYKPINYFIGLAVYIPYAVYLFFETNGVLAWINKHNTENIAATMQASKPWIEETREFFGLLILIIALVINMLWLKANNKH